MVYEVVRSRKGRRDRPRSGLVAVLLALAVTVAPARGQIDRATEVGVDSIFAEWDRADSPGAAVGVVREGRLVFTRGYGSAQLEYGIPIEPMTPFHVASEAKQFTAVAILLLAERGVLALDDDIRRWLAEVPDFGEPITIRHLLNHSSGLRDQWQALALAGRYSDDAITTGDVLRMVERQRNLNFEPGTTELYCNTGFTLLAEIVARASGRSFRRYAREEIFAPLGMTATHFHDDLRELVPHRAYSYGVDRESGLFERQRLDYAVPGATSLFTTVEDMARWLAELEAPSLGDTSLYDPLYARDTLNGGGEVMWGYGMNVGEHRGHVRMGHGGGDAGFRAWSVRFPEHDLGVVVLANLASINPGPFGDALALRVADLFLSPPREEPSDEREERRDPEPDLDAFVGSYEAEDGRILNVTNEFGVLRAWDPRRGRKTSLESAGQAIFTASVDSITRIAFEIEDGRAARIRVERGVGSWSGERVDPVPPEGVESYAGSYYSEELETTWTLEVMEDALVARHLMHDDLPLTPVVRDLFDAGAWFLGEARFLRDRAGNVEGLLVNAGRIRNVRFTRLERDR